MRGKAEPKNRAAKEIQAKIDAVTTNRGGGKAGVFCNDAASNAASERAVDSTLRGMKKWIESYTAKRPGVEVLQRQIDQWMADYDAREQQAKRDREAAEAEDGWTVVVAKTGRKRTTDETGLSVGAVALEAAEDRGNKKRKKKADTALDFYRFQRHEARRNEVLELQERFQEDKKRIAALKAARKYGKDVQIRLQYLELFLNIGMGRGNSCRSLFFVVYSLLQQRTTLIHFLCSGEEKKFTGLTLGWSGLVQREKIKRELVHVESSVQRLKVGQSTQHDAMRMDDEDGSAMPSRTAGIEDAQRASFRTDHRNGNGWPLSTAEMTPPAYNATARGEGRQVRIPRRRTRFPPPRSRSKGVQAPEHLEPTFLGKLERAGISATDVDLRPFLSRYSGRVGRGGRITVDRCKPLTQAPAGLKNHHLTASAPVTRGRPRLSSKKQ